MVARPADWPPVDSEIDLAIHDLPHRSSTTEWWYVNSHLKTDTDRNFSLFASFFRLATGENEQTQEAEYAHSVIWAISDLDTGKYHAVSAIDPRGPEIVYEQLEHDENADPLMARAMREVLKKNRLPSPDHLIKAPIMVNMQRLELDYGGNRFYKDADDIYHLELFDAETQTGCELTFQSHTLPILHGEDGVVRGLSNEDMYYYFMPRCVVEGCLMIDAERHDVKAASGWYDHEFGQQRAMPEPVEFTFNEDETTSATEENTAWNWISAQLSDDWAISAYDIVNMLDKTVAGRWVVVIDPAGNQKSYANFTFEPIETWTSVHTFSDYPTCWLLAISEANIELEIKAAFAEQEFITVLSPPAFWEGRVNITGTMHGQTINGRGYVERSGFNGVNKTKDFFAAVGRMTQRSVRQLLPLKPTRDHALRLIGSAQNSHFVDGIDLDQYARTVVQPLREIVDRGGKAWRSYACIACCEVVGGDASSLADWLAVPELFHVGSLIVDDVQDKSEVRRGGPAAHLLYGEPLAINAGTAAYFIGQLFMSTTNLSQTDQLRIYELYFETLRATHAGQAIDIDGLADLMPHAVESGESALLEGRVLAIHRLKSAVPARVLAMIGAILGNGSEAQINALGDFFEALGLAFQIIDDTLNLRGFKGDLKTKGEDIVQGKITMPIAKSMSRLSFEERRDLWTKVSSKPTDPLVIGSVIEKLENCCALRSCEEHAHRLVEDAWTKLDPLIDDSYVKLRLRAFGWYVLERHY
jgi:geranylgeranyl pyrophosphate synthase/predicted secreted hydrolase